MADDKTKRGKPDRVKINRGEPYELDYVAKKFGVKREDVRKAQEKVGPSREAVEKELKKVSKKP